MGELERLATFSDAPHPAVTRVLFTPTELAARAFIRQLLREADLEIREDGVGNIFARWRGSEPEAAPVATGSHIDAIPHSGRFDGTVGVLGGLEALRALREAGFQPRRTLELIVFTAEEPTRFAIGCLGSRALAGNLKPPELEKLRDQDGRLFVDIRQEAGYKEPLEKIALPHGSYAAFVELHIEQGANLERAGLPIGLVTDIAAPAALRVSLQGEGGHAGTVLMDRRRDVLPAAGEIILAVEKAATSTGRRHSVATVGTLTIFPGAANSIPQRATLEIDIRDTSQAPRDSMIAYIRASINAVCARRQITAEIEVINADPPSTSDQQILEAAGAACQQLHFDYQKMISHAYHDTLFMSLVCPTAMIFIPSRSGFSHRPEEYTSPEQIRKGVEVLALTLARMAG